MMIGSWDFLGIWSLVVFFLGFWAFGKNPLPFLRVAETRQASWDCLRGLAILGIVLIHLHSYFDYFGVANLWTLYGANLSRFAVPSFVLGSGIFLRKKPGFWKSRLTSLLLPYSLLSVLGSYLQGGRSFEKFLVDIVLGGGFAPYYFVPLLFQWFLLYSLIPESFWSSRWNLRLLPVSFLLQIWVPGWGLFPAFFGNFVFFFHFGTILRRNLTETKGEDRCLTALILVWLLLLPLLPTIQHLSLENTHLGSSLLLILGMYRLSSGLTPGRTSAFLQLLGRESLWIFFLHPPLLHALHGFSPESFGTLGTAYLVSLGLCLGLPILASFLKKKYS